MYRSTVDDQQFAPATPPQAQAIEAIRTASGASRINAVLIPGGVAIACVSGGQPGARVVSRPLVVSVDDSIGTRRLAGVASQSGDVHPARLSSALSGLLVEALKRGCSGNDPFVRHITLALLAVHGGTDVDVARNKPERGALKVWQEKVARDMLSADGPGAASLSDVACACGLSTPHFSRAFKRSVGMSPHRWSLLRRLDRAKRLLVESSFSLADVAFECGFCEQSHMNHAFSREFGMSPGLWRKTQRTRQAATATATAAAVPSFSVAGP
jgi:AraC-like DNA-binding protein